MSTHSATSGVPDAEQPRYRGLVPDDRARRRSWGRWALGGRCGGRRGCCRVGRCRGRCGRWSRFARARGRRPGRLLGSRCGGTGSWGGAACWRDSGVRGRRSGQFGRRCWAGRAVVCGHGSGCPPAGSAALRGIAGIIGGARNENSGEGHRPKGGQANGPECIPAIGSQRGLPGSRGLLTTARSRPPVVNTLAAPPVTVTVMVQ